jgi:hypothetical protein
VGVIGYILEGSVFQLCADAGNMYLPILDLATFLLGVVVVVVVVVNQNQ